ncbi:hypothetical protein F4776DRAFT_48446 [Hypoxylon sp. NC0597]|nr:hypothetical protein F4776DRAFT_48446 [Hypoxylon sp. NC0597]
MLARNSQEADTGRTHVRPAPDLSLQWYGILSFSFSIRIVSKLLFLYMEHAGYHQPASILYVLYAHTPIFFLIMVLQCLTFPELFATRWVSNIYHIVH